MPEAPVKIGAVTNVGLISDEEEQSLAVRSAEYRRLKAQALQDEAEGKNDTKYKPEEWGA